MTQPTKEQIQAALDKVKRSERASNSDDWKVHYHTGWLDQDIYETILATLQSALEQQGPSITVIGDSVNGPGGHVEAEGRMLTRDEIKSVTEQRGKE